MMAETNLKLSTMLLACCLAACGKTKPDADTDDSGGSKKQPQVASAASSAAAVPSTPSATVAPGMDPNKPELAPEDLGFVDTKEGWGWSDRCWKNIQQNKLGYAKAECAEGLKFAKSDGSTKSVRPSLLYNLGLIAERSGDMAGARDLFEQSLALRPNDEVSAALKRVGGTSKPSDSTDCLPCQSQEDFDAAMKARSTCCPVTACTSDASCSGGRVCCKIPDGQLCADASRCKGANRVSNAGGASAATGASCDPCDSYGCLDAADSVKASNPALAQQLAAKGCDLGKCGYLGTVALLRCRGYGLAKNPPGTTAPGERDDSMACRELCVGSCRSEMGDENTKCFDACEKRNCR